MDDIAVRGRHAPGWEPVRQAFRENFDHGEIGASCAVAVDGEIVVDLWGGHRDLARTRAWERDTIVNAWSLTKMLTNTAVLMLADRGAVGLDDPVARYWPEFAAAGKQDVTVRQVMAHTAGLPSFTEPVGDLDVFDWGACCARLAAQAPDWTPGDGSGYHAETQGWLLGELIRRVDGRTPGRFIGDEIAGPTGADVHVGLADRHHARVADVSVLGATSFGGADPGLARRQAASSRRSAGLVNTATWRRAEMPASNVHTNARGMVTALAPLACGGTNPRSGVRLVGADTLEEIFAVQADGIDRVLGRRIRFGTGFGLHCGDTPVGVNERTFWWAGWGGSMCVVDVENRLVVAYVMNRMLGDDDLRAARVVFAAHAARGAA